MKISIIILAVAIVLGVFIISENKPQINLGNLFTNENAYSSASYTSSTLVANTATLAIQRATSSRTFGKICNPTSTSTVWVYKQATSTGVVAGMGDPIFSSSTAASKTCVSYDNNDPYIGQVWVISEGTPKITIESKQE